VNEKTQKKYLAKREATGPLVLRGANVCLYTLREASQGEPLYLDAAGFLADKPADAKAHHSRQGRIGFQRSSPQNNFRRIIAAPIPPRQFCFDTISYIPDAQSSLPPRFLLALLNSALANWYFLLGSTNSKVNEYQFNNLPCPVFAASLTPNDARVQQYTEADLAAGRTADGLERLRPLLVQPPFSPAVRAVIMAAVEPILTIEANRGKIARKARSALAPAAQPYQDFLDALFFGMAGLTAEEVAGLKERCGKLRKM
jgi:hypothetical protein